MNRGDVGIVDFPFASGTSAKLRPALVVQNNRDNRRLSNTIVAMITGNIRRAGEPTQLLVDPATPEGGTSGLRKPSVINCVRLFTVEQQDIVAVIGHLSAPSMQNIDACLRAALSL
jgi:mRNA interferase MazF